MAGGVSCLDFEPDLRVQVQVSSKGFTSSSTPSQELPTVMGIELWVSGIGSLNTKDELCAYLAEKLPGVPFDVRAWHYLNRNANFIFIVLEDDLHLAYTM